MVNVFFDDDFRGGFEAHGVEFMFCLVDVAVHSGAVSHRHDLFGVAFELVPTVAVAQVRVA